MGLPQDGRACSSAKPWMCIATELHEVVSFDTSALPRPDHIEWVYHWGAPSTILSGAKPGTPWP